jgi:hypothetical protein
MTGKHPCFLGQLLEEVARRLDSSRLEALAKGVEVYPGLPRCNQALPSNLSDKELLEALIAELQAVMRNLPSEKKRYVNSLWRKIEEECPSLKTRF